VTDMSAHDGRSHVERLILEAVRAIRYGSVEIVIHNNEVVQIERKEKVRIEAPPRRTGAPEP